MLTHVNTSAAFGDRSITPVINEGGFATLQGTIIESDRLDTFALSINWGDGTATERHTFPAGSGGKLVTLAHQYLSGRATPYEVSLRWLDQHGGGNSDQLFVKVHNAAPVADIVGPTSLTTGQLATFGFQAIDPAPQDQASSMQWSIDWGDETFTSIRKPAQFSQSHTYTAPGDYLIRAVARDRDGLVSAIVTHRVHVEATVDPSPLANLLLSGEF